MNRPLRYSLPVLFLIAANLVPLAGVYLFGWKASTLLILYWLESVVIGVLNIPKILACRDPARKPAAQIFGAVFMAAFFCVHFGAFSYAHGLVLFHLFGGLEGLQLTASEVAQNLDTPNLGVLQKGITAFGAAGLFWAAASFAASHLFSMIYHFFGKREYLTRAPQQQIFAPYKRIFIMHFVIIIAAGLLARFQTALLPLILLIILKTSLDLAAHLKEHKMKPSADLRERRRI